MSAGRGGAGRGADPRLSCTGRISPLLNCNSFLSTAPFLLSRLPSFSTLPWMVYILSYMPCFCLMPRADNVRRGLQPRARLFLALRRCLLQAAGATPLCLYCKTALLWDSLQSVCCFPRFGGLHATSQEKL